LRLGCVYSRCNGKSLQLTTTRGDSNVWIRASLVDQANFFKTAWEVAVKAVGDDKDTVPRLLVLDICRMLGYYREVNADSWERAGRSREMRLFAESHHKKLFPDQYPANDTDSDSSGDNDTGVDDADDDVTAVAAALACCSRCSVEFSKC
jgi:hypothetical protein